MASARIGNPESLWCVCVETGMPFFWLPPSGNSKNSAVALSDFGAIAGANSGLTAAGRTGVSERRGAASTSNDGQDSAGTSGVAAEGRTGLEAGRALFPVTCLPSVSGRGWLAWNGTAAPEASTLGRCGDLAAGDSVSTTLRRSGFVIVSSDEAVFSVATPLTTEEKGAFGIGGIVTSLALCALSADRV